MAKTWLPDPSHYPEQMTPLSATVWFASMGRGLHEAMRALAGPFGGFETRTELGWAYELELEPEWEPDSERLREAALALPERWERELLPRVRELGVERDVTQYEPRDALKRLFRSGPGRRWLRALEEYLLRYGGRARWHELSLPREAEFPALTFEAVRLWIERSSSVLGPGPGQAPVVEADLAELVERVR